MKGIDITFKKVQGSDGSLQDVVVPNCLVAPNGTATASRPQIIIHLPKSFSGSVKDGWIDYAGDSYHVLNRTNSGATAPLMNRLSPTEWNRYVIAERIA